MKTLQVMKTLKILLLGSGAGLIAVTAGQAADLPVKAKPIEYVRVCSLYGAGFWYVPGTDTCLKIGSYIREQVEWNAGNGGTPIGLGAGGGAPAWRCPGPARAAHGPARGRRGDTGSAAVVARH